MTHRVLQRQLKKLGLSEAAPPSSPEAWQAFLERVGRTYENADQDRYLLERSLQLSSREMQELYRDLEQRVISELDRLRAVIGSLGAGLCLIEPDGRVRSINPEAGRLLGYGGQALVGQPFAAVLQTPGDEAALAICLAEGQPHRDQDAVFIRQDGTPLPVSFTLTPLREADTIRGAVLVFFDITERKQSQEHLEHSLSLLQSTLESTADGIVAVDLDQRVVDYNENFLKMWRLPESSLMGTFAADTRAFMGEQLVYPGSFLTGVDKIYTNRAAESFDVLHCKDGRIFERSSRPQRLGDEVIGRVWSFRDVTERRRAEQALDTQRRFLRQIIDTNPNFIFAKDSAGRFTLVNHAVAQAYGTTVEDLIGKTDADFNACPEEVERFREHDRKVMETGMEYFVPEEPLTDARGQVRWLQTIKRPILGANGRPVQVLGVSVDITERRKAADALRQYAQDLEATKHTLEIQALQLAQAVRELETAKNAAEASARLKATILNNVSHEIRTPITSILGYAQILAEEVGEEHHEFLQYIFENGKRLLITLNSILDLSRIESGGTRFEMTQVDLCDTARSTVTMVIPMVQQRGLTLRFEGPSHPVMAHVDGTAVGRILQNLLSNAVKFTAEGTVTVQVGQHDDEVFLAVHDTGIGISEAFLPLLFEEFQQESSGLDRSHEGSGLGLSITRRLVAAMHGRIEVKSQKGEGSTFMVHFPAATPHTPSTNGHASGPAPRYGASAI